MPILVNTTTDVLLAVTERVKLPLSKRYVTSISQFYNEARIVRKERREKKIGLQRQHEILADKWNSLIGSGMTQSVVEEIGGIGKGDEEKVKLGQNENKEDEGGSGMGDGLGESDNEGNAMDLVRWFSWAGAEDSAPWGGEEEEEPQVDHG
ncbi:hypothetical protein EJ08DRAFT_130707 [Tothia fuscella]|uniref:Uncharacterized protein n=1 Tax=Tothia fuscella TaxID=1048955 RepID=A0A9P4NVA0_9PEZI|nr:hypothetical protein EJ08DRAFT_130707 [Tothia fuscella]